MQPQYGWQPQQPRPPRRGLGIGTIVVIALVVIGWLAAVGTFLASRAHPEASPADAGIDAGPPDVPDPEATATLARDLASGDEAWHAVYLGAEVSRRGDTVRGIVRTNVAPHTPSTAAVSLCVRVMLALPGPIGQRKVRVLDAAGNVVAHNGPGRCVAGGWFAP